MRGVPINVDIPVDGGTMSVSLATLCPFGESVDDMGTPHSRSNSWTSFNLWSVTVHNWTMAEQFF